MTTTLQPPGRADGAGEAAPAQPAPEPAGPALDSAPVLPVGAPPGRDAQFSAFARESSATLLRTAWYLTGDEHLAAELVQDALVRTYVAWPRASRHDPTAYARRVVANARIDHWRRRRRELLVEPGRLPDAACADAGHDVVMRDALVRALATLPGRQRRVVVLRYLVGLTEREVADDLGVAVGTVKTQASRGLARLRAVLGQHDTDVPSTDDERNGR